MTDQTFTPPTKPTRYHFQNGYSRVHKQIAVVEALDRETAEKRLAQELGYCELPMEWRLVKFELR